MLLGILSDTHGHVGRTASAVSILRTLGAGEFVHCGDVGGEPILELLAGTGAWFVWGNTDHPDPGLVAAARALGLKPPGESPVRFELDGRRFAVFHGHEPDFEQLAGWIRQERADRLAERLRGTDYVLFGHTHEASDLRVGGARFINPGALKRAAVPSVATLDPASDDLRFWAVPESWSAGVAPRELHVRHG